RNCAPIDLSGRNRLHRLAGDTIGVWLLRRHRAQIKQGEAKWRMHERGLHVHAEHDAEPDEIDTQMVRRRSDERDDNKREFEEVEKEGEQEHKHVHEDKKAQLTSRKGGEKVLDPNVAIDAEERQREHASADQNEYDERGELRGRFNCLSQKVP